MTREYKGRTFERPIHGTYPFDTNNWETVRRDLPKEEAAKLVGIPDDEITDYMWLNKGYIIINSDIKPGSSLGAVFAEMMTANGVQTAGVPVGAEAVFLGDGTYYLIRKVR